MNCLVTGANGFLGAWLCKKLIEHGHKVTALVRKNSDVSDLKGLDIKFSFGDVTDINSLLLAAKDQDSLFHLAGIVAYKKSERPLMDLVNIKGTENIIQVCETLRIPKLIHLSSVVAIGATFEPVVQNEGSEYKIKNLNLGYFETKRIAEEKVLTAVKENRINAVCVNPSTIYGPADAKKGSRKTQLKVARGEFPFYTLGGVNVVSVNDVTEGILNAYALGKNGERYILSGENYSIKQLFEIISHCSGVKPPSMAIPNFLLHSLGFIGDRLGLGISQENAYTASMYHWFESTKAQKDINFKPTSSLAAIENSVRWMKDNGYLN